MGQGGTPALACSVFRRVFGSVSKVCLMPMNLSSCQRSVFGAILGPLFYLALVGRLHAQVPLGFSPIQKTPGQTAKGSSSGSGKEINRFEKEIQKIETTTAPLPVGTILFTGSSSIGRWKLAESFPGLQTANHGFGGSPVPDRKPCPPFPKKGGLHGSLYFSKKLSQRS